MKKEVYYRQVKMKKGNTQRTSWIPEQFAVVGKMLKIDMDGEWNEGWIVEHVGSTRRDSATVRERSRDHLRHRKKTDI
jgi:hypothetical protein